MQQNWTPALCMSTGVLGAALLIYGAKNRRAVRIATDLAGSAMLARAASNCELRNIVGIGDGPRAIEVDKTVHLQAPIEQAFAFWSNYHNFPRVMTHIKRVRDLGGGKSYWVADGPGGLPVSWTAEITKCIPNKLLSWRSLPGSAVQNEGVVRFEKSEGIGTRVSIQTFYRPPAGVIGHEIASFLGADLNTGLTTILLGSNLLSNWDIRERAGP